MLRALTKCYRPLAIVPHCSRSYSYKEVKRPNISTLGIPNQPVDKVKGESSLADQLKARILAAGPLTVADYMRQVLTNPVGGYYMKKDVFGRQGDFITSPEIAQIFGELIAVWCLSEWVKCGSPSPLKLVELGPGRGTLLRDIFRVLSRFGITDQLQVCLVEVSPHLSDVQAKLLCADYSECQPTDQQKQYLSGQTPSGIRIAWYHKIEDVPTGFSIYLAHEFFDALPIHKFQKDGDKWREILIDVDPSAENKFRYVRSMNETPMLKLFLSRTQASCLAQKEHVEYSVETEQIVETLATRIDEFGGISLIMDYGGGEKSDTFRAFKNHVLHDPLLNPGTADLTADVDFELIKQAAERDDRLITYGPIEQGDFINRMGGKTRLEALINSSTVDSEIENLKTGYEMLTSPTQMGSRFKVLSMFPSVLKSHLAKFPPNAFVEVKK